MFDRLLIYQSEAEQLLLKQGVGVAEPEVPFSPFLGASGIRDSIVHTKRKITYSLQMIITSQLSDLKKI